MAEPILQGRDLSRTFGSGATCTHALRNVSIELARGEITLLMGPSGSGKSTLLAVLSGLLRPDGGQVIAAGVDLWRLSDREREKFRLRECGFIFQGYNLFAALTARQQLEMVLRWGEGATRREARRRTAEVLDLLGLGKKGDLFPGQLSGGEKQRVAIGRALIKGPSLCFADEPTSALDWGNGEQVIRLLCETAHRRKAAVMVVAHDARIVPWVDRVCHMEDGCLLEPVAERSLS
jgi:putative ABC transport system ATP-binding protein